MGSTTIFAGKFETKPEAGSQKPEEKKSQIVSLIVIKY